MKKILIKLAILSFLVVLSSNAHCQNYDMHINLNDGSTITFAIDDIQRIEFGNPTGIDGADDNMPVIQSLILMQNFPNPFNPATTIEYQIPKTGDVTIRVYNIGGQLVKELLNETQSKGTHEVHWDGLGQNNEQVASGIYIYTVKSDGLTLSKKMMLVK